MKKIDRVLTGDIIFAVLAGLVVSQVTIYLGIPIALGLTITILLLK